MPRGPQTFKQGDVTRAIKAAQKAGLEVQRVEIDPLGKIVIYSGKGDSKPEYNEWDEVLDPNYKWEPPISGRRKR